MKCLPKSARRASSPVAPPCGERGLKFVGACAVIILMRVAPPCGERGLKSLRALFLFGGELSLPLAGSVD